MFSDQHMHNPDGLNLEALRLMLPKRSSNAEKRDFGSVLIVGGSKGMAGAVILAATAALRSGAGLVTTLIPNSLLTILQSSVHEAIAVASADEDFHVSLNEDITRFTSVALGPGLGTHKETAGFVRQVLEQSTQPLIIDADALNHISREKLHGIIPEGSVLTPHLREFERLFGTFASADEQLEAQHSASVSRKIFIIRKGANSVLTTPAGEKFINPTGNPGLAKGGSGDVLTGMIAGLYARTKNMEHAARLGMCLHGLAADVVVERSHEEAMIAGDVVGAIPEAFRRLSGNV